SANGDSSSAGSVAIIGALVVTAAEIGASTIATGTSPGTGADVVAGLTTAADVAAGMSRISTTIGVSSSMISIGTISSSCCKTTPALPPATLTLSGTAAF